MIATILAAGKGSRLMPRTEFVPKTLVPVNGKPMLFYVLDAIREAGIKEVIIVVGYQKDVFKSVVGDRYKDLKISYVDNDEYDVSNNIYSFALLEKHIPDNLEEIFMLESDLVLDKNLLKRMRKMPAANYSLISPISDWMNGTTADVIEDGSIGGYYLKDDQKHPTYNHANKFKTVNVYRFQTKDLKDTIFPAVQTYMEEFGRDDYYEKVFQVLMAEGKLKKQPYIIDQHSWFEVDSDDDLREAEDLL